MRIHISLRRVSLLTAAVLMIGIVAAAPAMAKTLYVSAAKGSDSNSCTTKKKACQTITAAVTKAKRGDLITVASGTYDEQVTISKDLKLLGNGKPVIDAVGHANAVLISGAKAAGSHVSGFVTENALNEGILATRTSRLKITGNVVKNNDAGSALSTLTGECTAQGSVPGDCGEGLHLQTVSYSKVSGNVVKGNSGGILLTDEMGPTHGNVITRNRVLDNLYDCGITIASHSTTAYTGGRLHKRKGGIYNNTISHNVSDGNGTKGQGAGILMAAPQAGGAVYDNVVTDNIANGDGQGGFVLHSHVAGQYFNGNKVISNTFHNDGSTGDSSSGVTQKAGIIVFSATTALKHLQITGNRISGEYYGIWTQHAPKIHKAANRFKNVTVDVHQQ